MKANTPNNGQWAEIQVYRARMPVSPAHIDAYLEVMALMDTPPGSWEDVETGEAWIEAYTASETHAAQMADEIAAIAESVDGKQHFASVALLPKEDWTESWKRFFHVLHITDRIVIRPIWEPYEAAKGERVIDIEPGMSFGTGIHPTTQSCIRFLEQLADTTPPSHSVVDMGCGSGILAIAARKLGFSTVSGYDYDPSAVKTAHENADINGFNIPFEISDALDPVLPNGDIVVANILAPVLIEAAPAITRAVNKTDKHALILSGILDSQYAEVKAAYEAQGFSEQSSILDGEWRSGHFAR